MYGMMRLEAEKGMRMTKEIKGYNRIKKGFIIIRYEYEMRSSFFLHLFLETAVTSSNMNLLSLFPLQLYT